MFLKFLVIEPVDVSPVVVSWLGLLLSDKPNSELGFNPGLNVANLIMNSITTHLIEN